MKNKSLDQRVTELEAALELLRIVVIDTGTAAGAIIPIICTVIPGAKPRVAQELNRAIAEAGGQPAIVAMLRVSLDHLD
jgi:hypothetical protein